MVDSKSRYSFMFGELVAVDIEYRVSAGRISELKSLKDQDVLLIQIESNFNFKRRIIKLARSQCYIVQSGKQDHSAYRAKQNNGCEGKEARNLHAANTLKAHSFVLACQCTMCVRSPYSLKSRGGSQLKDITGRLRSIHVRSVSQ